MAAIERGTAYSKKVNNPWLKDMWSVGLNSALAPIEDMTGKNFYNPEVSTTGNWQKAMDFTDKQC